jgi:hypothetical protein
MRLRQPRNQWIERVIARQLETLIDKNVTAAGDASSFRTDPYFSNCKSEPLPPRLTRIYLTGSK